MLIPKAALTFLPDETEEDKEDQQTRKCWHRGNGGASWHKGIWHAWIAIALDGVYAIVEDDNTGEVMRLHLSDFRFREPI